MQTELYIQLIQSELPVGQSTVIKQLIGLTNLSHFQEDF